MALILTGAAGHLGGVLREPMAKLAAKMGMELVSSDFAPLTGELHPNERFVQCDVSQRDQVDALVAGAHMVIHFGAIGDEAPFEEIWGPNFMGAYNIWEASYRAGVRRVVYASSIHAVGMTPKGGKVDLEVPHRPDTFYGLSKCFAEDLGRMYWEKRQFESVCMRICSCAPVGNARALGTWLSYPDLIQLVIRAIDTPVVQWTVIYGVSNNDRSMFNNDQAAHLGFRPQDNAEQYADEMLANEPAADPSDINIERIGGPFAGIKLGHGALSLIKRGGEFAED